MLLNQVKGFILIGIMECWNNGIMGPGKLECWVNDKIPFDVII
jgi:hypothetical protein